MPSKLMLPLLGMLALAASPSYAQDEVPASKPQATAPYSTLQNSNRVQIKRWRASGCES